MRDYYLKTWYIRVALGELPNDLRCRILGNSPYERAHRVKWNNDNKENNDQTMKPSTVVTSYYILKTNKISCIKQNHEKLEISISKKIFQDKLQR